MIEEDMKFKISKGAVGDGFGVYSIMTIEELREHVSEHPKSVNIPINYNDTSDLVEFMMDLGYTVDITEGGRLI